MRNNMQKVKVSIKRTEVIEMEIDVPDNVSKTEIYKKIADDPSEYLEKHLDNVGPATVDWSIEDFNVD